MQPVKLLLGGLVLSVAACGNVAAPSSGTSSPGEPSQSSTTAAVSKAGSAIAELCRRTGVTKKLRDMKQAGYYVAQVKIDGVEAPISLGEPAILYTPITVTYLRTYSKTATQPTRLYVGGGETVDYVTAATGPAGVAPDSIAVIFVPPAGYMADAPTGLVETALPVDGRFVFAPDDCWTKDLPEGVAVSQTQPQLVNGKKEVGAARPGVRIPLGLIEGLL